VSYEVSLKAYEGPLDLLLDLIREKKVDIYDIPISMITKEYLERIKQMEEAELEVASEFVVMAATLMEIKARMLLPKEKSQETEEEEDPRLDLVSRLLIYKQFKEASLYLADLYENQGRVFARSNINQLLLEEIRPEEDLRNMQVSLSDLCQALQVVLESVQEEIEEVPREKVTIEQQMNWLLICTKESGMLLFQDLFSILKSKVLIVVTFMALLELVHRDRLSVRQDELTKEIFVYYLNNEDKGEDYES